MAYDEDLADRVRAALPGDVEVTERKMFGGLAFLLGGHMFAGIVGGELMVRLGHRAAQQALERDDVREMDFTGRPMKSMIFVQPAGLHGPALQHWVTAAADHARTLPLKPPKDPIHQPSDRSSGTRNDKPGEPRDRKEIPSIPSEGSFRR
jgi:TfoX/Sxy family transcriptional regulator of competence genes